MYILYIYRGDVMQIIISNSSEVPIYEQIKEAIKTMILSGELLGGEALPSIRSLAKDLRISVITTKRAYEELEKEEYIETVPGKGCFVKTKSDDFRKEEIFKKIEQYLGNAVTIAQQYQISRTELEEILTCLYEEETYEK